MKYVLMFFNICLSLGLSVGSTVASAYQKTETFKIKNPKALALNKADERDLRISKLERSLKNTLAGNYLSRPNRFSADMEDLRNSPLYQSFIDEVAECVGIFGKKSRSKTGKDAYAQWMANCPLEIARDVAKRQMFLSIKRNWSNVGSTIFNDFGEDDWSRARPFVIRKIQEGLVYAPRSQNKKDFVFYLPNGGFVQVERKTLSSGQIRFEIGPTDRNPLEPGSENIRADIDVNPEAAQPEASGEVLF